jgi:hypothetical protein
VLDQYSPDQLNAFWAAVTGVSAVVTGVVAILTLRSLKRDSIDRTRPVIAIEVLPVVLSHGTCESPRVSWRLDYLEPAPIGTGVSG